MNKKKLLALLMALVMTLSLLPVTAFAELVKNTTVAPGAGNWILIGTNYYKQLDEDDFISGDAKFVYYSSWLKTWGVTELSAYANNYSTDPPMKVKDLVLKSSANSLVHFIGVPCDPDEVGETKPITNSNTGTGYENLGEALAAAGENETVVLNENINLSETVVVNGTWFTSPVKLDLNGHTIRATNCRALWIKSGNISIRNGTIESVVDGNNNSAAFSSSSSVIRVGDSAENPVSARLVVFGDATVTTEYCYGISVFGKNQPADYGEQLVVQGTVISNGSGAIASNGSSDLTNPSIEIQKGEVTSSKEAGIYLPAGKLTISGGTITGKTAVYFKSTDMEISGGTLHGTGENTAYAYSGNGYVCTGDALVIDNCNYPKGTGSISVTGGTFNSDHADSVHSYKGNEAKDVLGAFISGGKFNKEPDAALLMAGYVTNLDGDWYKPVLAESYTVTFDTQHGSAVDSQSVVSGLKATRPADPIRIGYTFNGWNFDFNTPITHDTTITANWTQDASFIGENKIRIAGQLDLFGADIQVKPNYDVAMTLYKGYDGFSDENASIRIAANNVQALGIGSKDRTLDVANVTIDSLSAYNQNINHAFVYNVLDTLIVEPLSKQTINFTYGGETATYSLSKGRGNGYLTLNLTADNTTDFTDAWIALTSSNAVQVNPEIPLNEAAYNLTLAEGSMVQIGNEVRRITKTTTGAYMYDDNNGGLEVDLNKFMQAFYDAYEDIEVAIDPADEDTIVLLFKAGTGATVGQTSIVFNEDVTFTITGLNPPANMIDQLNNFSSATIANKNYDELLAWVREWTSIIPNVAGNEININAVVTVPEKVAEVNDVEYETLQAAITAAQNGQTIELLKDFTLSSYVTVPNGKTVKLDYKGYTITSELADSYAPIENCGTLTVVDTSAGKTGGIAGVNRCINNYGTLNVGTGVFDEETKTTSDKVFGGNYSTTNLTGGTAIQNKSPDGTMNFYDCIVNAMNYGVYNMGIANVYGGTFNGASCSACRNNWFYTFSSEGTLTIYDATVTGVHGALGVVGGSGYVYGGSYSAIACANNHANNAGTFRALYVAGEQANVSAEVYGGYFSSEGYAVALNGNNGDGGLKQNASLKIYGGTFEAKSSHTKVFENDAALGDPLIAGGTFKAQNSGKIEAFKTSVTDKQYLATNRTLKKIDDLTYEVTIKYEEQSTTDTAVTNEDGDTTTSTAFAVDNTNETPIYAIKTQVTRVVDDTPATETTYTKVDVYTGTAAKFADDVSYSNATEDAKQKAQAVINNYSTGSATFEATLFANDAASPDNVLKTAAAANAIAKAAAQEDVDVSYISEAKVILQTTLKAVGTNGGKATVRYDITPVAQLYNEGGGELGKPVALNNEDIEEGQTFTFNIPVPANMEGDRIKVSHIGSNGYATEIGTYTPVGSAGNVRYITVTVDHFSDFELEEQAVDITGSCKVSASIALNDSIDIKFYVKELAGDKNSYKVVYSFNGGDVITVPGDEWTETTPGSGKYGFTVASCAAKQMNDTVSFKVYYVDGGNDALVKEVKDYSIRQYCVNKITANSNTELVALCRATLSYGAEAQKYFNYKTEPEQLADRDNMGLTNGETSVPANLKVSSAERAGDIGKLTASLNTISKTQINFYVTTDSPITIVSVTKDGNELDGNLYTSSPVQNGRTLITIKGLAATDLDATFVLTFTTDAGTSRVTYSALSYCYNKQSTNTARGLSLALYNYYLKAEAYFIKYNH